jgi:tetratricopeptide (TPR) repeat protein
MNFSQTINKFHYLTLGIALAVATPVLATNTDDAWILNKQGLYKISQGNTKGAIADFEKACQLDPFNDTALANLACARNNLGVKYAKQQNFKEAVRQFRNAKDQKPEDISIRLNLLSTLVTIKNVSEADREIKELLKLRPNDSDLAIKAATAYQKIENSNSAIATLQEFTERFPNDYKANYTLSRLLYLNGDLAECRFYLNRCLEMNPNDSKCSDLLSKLDKEVSIEQNTNTFTGKHFELACPDSFSEEWVEELLEQLESAYEEVGSKLNYYPEQKAKVLLFQTNDFKEVHDLPDWAGGVYDGKIKLPVPMNTIPIALKGAILHEYTHHVVFLASSGNCPIWLNEGLAQIFEKNSEDLPEIPEVYFEYDEKLQSIDEGFKSSPNRITAIKLYKLSFNTTCKLINEYGWNSVADLLRLLSIGKSFDEASSEVLGESKETIESRIIAYR